jgi:hypothetical protein
LYVCGSSHDQSAERPAPVGVGWMKSFVVIHGNKS